jgi:hypothetical protein
MPIHDWTKVEAGDFHDFHQCWVVAIRSALNTGLLPPGYMAMAEQVTGRPIPDVVRLRARESKECSEGGTAVPTAPPTARVIAKIERVNFASRADRVVIRHGRGTSETRYIPAPLEATYQEAWAVFPHMLKELIEPTA